MANKITNEKQILNRYLKLHWYLAIKGLHLVKRVHRLFASMGGISLNSILGEIKFTHKNLSLLSEMLASVLEQKCNTNHNCSVLVQEEGNLQSISKPRNNR